MARRTKEQIAEELEMTCSKRGCNGVHEEVFSFSSYHRAAVAEDIEDMPFCEKHFLELESKMFKKL